MSESPNPLPVVSSRAEFAVAVQWFAEAAIRRGARTMWWLDRDFSDWPLDELALLAVLAPWLRMPQRRLVLIAADWSRVRSDHARFCAWRVPWSHAVETLRAQEDDAAEIGAVLFDDGPTSLQMLDRDRWRGRCSVDPVDAHLLRERFDALAQRSTPDFPVTMLGL
jgi:hypothetical protein